MGLCCGLHGGLHAPFSMWWGPAQAQEAADAVGVAALSESKAQEGAQPAKKGGGAAAAKPQADDPAKYPSKESIGPFCALLLPRMT